MPITRFRAGLILLLTVVAIHWPNSVRGGGLHWPPMQLLPHFSAPAGMLDCVDMTSASAAEVDLFTSLQGIVNRAQPRIATVMGDRAGGDYTWLDLHQLHYRMTDGYAAILKYRKSVTGLVVTDPEQPHTLNLATTMAGVNNELICSPDLLPKLTNAPYHLPVTDDLRGRFRDKYAVYGYLYSNYWPRCTHRIFAGMGPAAHGHLRDYLVAVKSATVWLGPGNRIDADLLRRFVSDMKPVGGVYMGWWPGEGDGLEWIAHYGIPVLASDLFRNGSVFSGVASPIHIPAIPPPPPLENRVYVALILSDGDNVQYMQHTMKKNWDDPVRGTIPIGWTASPLAVDMDPMMLDYYWTTATTNDCLVSGPSGAGYAHINDWDADNVKGFAKISAPYLKRSGLRIITIWDRVTPTVAQAFAANDRTLLGLTDEGGTYQNVDHGLRTMPLTPAYTSRITNMIDSITRAAAGWDGTAPRFIAAQSDVWKLGPRDLAEVARALAARNYALVRPDQLFLLANQKR